MEALSRHNRIRLPVRCIPERAIQTAEGVIAGEYGIGDAAKMQLRQSQVEEMAALLLALAKKQEHTCLCHSDTRI